MAGWLVLENGERFDRGPRFSRDRKTIKLAFAIYVWGQSCEVRMICFFLGVQVSRRRENCDFFRCPFYFYLILEFGSFRFCVILFLCFAVMGFRLDVLLRMLGWLLKDLFLYKKIISESILFFK